MLTGFPATDHTRRWSPDSAIEVSMARLASGFEGSSKASMKNSSNQRASISESPACAGPHSPATPLGGLSVPSR